MNHFSQGYVLSWLILSVYGNTQLWNDISGSSMKGKERNDCTNLTVLDLRNEILFNLTILSALGNIWSEIYSNNSKLLFCFFHLMLKTQSMFFQLMQDSPQLLRGLQIDLLFSFIQLLPSPATILHQFSHVLPVFF